VPSDRCSTGPAITDPRSEGSLGVNGLRKARQLVAHRGQRRSLNRRLRQIREASPAPRTTTRVYYGVDQMPARSDVAAGGFLKFQRLSEAFPNASRDFNVLYLGSSSIPPDTNDLIALARERGAAVVWNQNGVAYPAWHGPGWEQLNEVLARPMHEADHVVYQSEFCRLSADRFLGQRVGPSEVLYNAVDTRIFEPAERTRQAHVTLLLAGSQRHRYRVVRALETVALLKDVDVSLLVAGPLRWAADPLETGREARELVKALGIERRVEFVGQYTQAEAPELFRRADVLLHPQYNDACPTLVLEAMASGLAVVYSASGGVPELVGAEAGVGVPAPLDWDNEHPPDPAVLAESVVQVVARLNDYQEAARDRAVTHFDVRPWIERHRTLFREVLR
jgi:glycosyltransferase involved in cell wall biosynthesis